MDATKSINAYDMSLILSYNKRLDDNSFLFYYIQHRTIIGTVHHKIDNAFWGENLYRVWIVKTFSENDLFSEKIYDNQP